MRLADVCSKYCALDKRARNSARVQGPIINEQVNNTHYTAIYYVVYCFAFSLSYVNFVAYALEDNLHYYLGNGAEYTASYFAFQLYICSVLKSTESRFNGKQRNVELRSHVLTFNKTGRSLLERVFRENLRHSSAVVSRHNMSSTSRAIDTERAGSALSEQPALPSLSFGAFA